MSHYDEDYEAEELKRKKLYKAICKKALEKVKVLPGALPGDVPKRFLGSLEDLENWLEMRLRG